MNLAGFLVAMVGPLMARWLVSMGLSLVTLVGSQAAFDALLSNVQAGVAGLASAALGLGGLYGLWQALGIVLGAASFVLTWNSTAGWWKLAKA